MRGCGCILDEMYAVLCFRMLTFLYNGCSHRHETEAMLC